MSAGQSAGRRKRSSSPHRLQLGSFWLWYRADRDDWAICWLDGRATRRRSIGIGGGSPDNPPEEARKALAEHYLKAQTPVTVAAPDAPRAPGDVLLADLMRRWLEEHVAHLAAGERYAESVLVLQRFFEERRAAGLLVGPLTVGSVTRDLVAAFIAWRKDQGASPATISRDLAALRGPINWALKEQIISSAPRIPDVKGKARRRELEYSPEQVAAILEAAWASPDRRHVHLYALIHLSTHGRSEAILELEARQIRDGLIFFNAPGREQTSKRRSIVPITPVLAPWLEGAEGKIIRYRVATSEKNRKAGGPEWFERDTRDIGRAFEACLVAAHEASPHLGLARQATDKNGNPVWLPPRAKLRETERRPKIVGIGSPNTLRHTIHTWHQRRGVPQAQIDAAAGHNSERGSGANYTHMRPEYLREFLASTEAFWAAVGQHTDVHLRYQCDTKTVELELAQ
jgi:integrase